MQNSNFVLRWINFSLQACLAQQAQSSTAKNKQTNKKPRLLHPRKQVWMNQLHSWPFPTPPHPHPPEPPTSQSTKPAGPLCQSLAGDGKMASENRHPVVPIVARFSSGGKTFLLRRHQSVAQSSKAVGHQSVALSLTVSHTACFSRCCCRNWAGSSIILISPDSSNFCSQFHWGLGANSEKDLPLSLPNLSLCCQFSLSNGFAMQTPPHSPPSDVEWHGELLVTFPSGTPDLSVTSLPLGTGNGLLGLMPKDFPDPHR